jgi:glyoxylase-like metal-dependent hydrolase (beta-lactamase superfamily II)
MGTKIFDKGMMTYQHDYGVPYTIPIYAWLLQGGGPRILVDTGEMMPIVSPDREKNIGGKIYTFEEGLARYELAPGDIDIIIHTHLHNDHCENDEKCENATIYVHPAELEHAHNPHPLDFRYMDDYILEPEQRGQFKTVDKDTEIASGVRMVHTPAHTEGGMSVFIKTAQGTAVITGFCVITENFFPPKQIQALDMDVIPPGTSVNPAQAYDIMLNVKRAADILLPLHEPRFASAGSIPE